MGTRGIKSREWTTLGKDLEYLMKRTKKGRDELLRELRTKTFTEILTGKNFDDINYKRFNFKKNYE